MTTKTKPRIAGSALHLLHRAGQAADILFAKQFDERELTPRQYAVMAALTGNERASQTDLVKITGIDRSTLAEIVKRLCDRGLMSRMRSIHDARAYSVRLTPAGHKLVEDAMPAVQRIEERMFESLPVSQRSKFADDLCAIVAATTDAQFPDHN